MGSRAGAGPPKSRLGGIPRRHRLSVARQPHPDQAPVPIPEAVDTKAIPRGTVAAGGQLSTGTVASGRRVSQVPPGFGMPNRDE